MIILNFSHPLTKEQITSVESLAGQKTSDVIHIACHFENAQDFIPQVHQLLQSVPLSASQWQTLPILLNPPSLAPITAIMIAELHGRMGFFPAILRLSPVAGSVPVRFEPVEIINLQQVRDDVRKQR